MTENLPYEGLHQVIKEADAFLEQNLVQACQEILDWSRTAILADGILREAARQYFSKLDPYRDLLMAENAVKRLALTRIVAMNTPETVES